MILLENKITIFNKIVFLKIEKQCKERLAFVKEKYDKKIEKKKQELDKMKSDLIERRKNLANQKGYEMIAKVNEDRRILFLQKDDELLDKLMTALKEKLKKFTDTKEYLDFERERFEIVLQDLETGQYIVSILSKDLEKLGNLFEKIAKEKAIQINFEELSKDYIGGFCISDTQKTYNIDCSLKEKIEDKRYEIGKLLHFTLKEAGDKIE